MTPFSQQREQPGAELAAAWGLPRLGSRPGIGRYLAQIWSRRHFAIELARARFQSENEQDRLGIAWVVIRPLINAAVYGVVFSLLLRSDTRPDNFVPFLVTGVFVFQFFSGCLSDGAKSITGSMGLVRTLHFPRALLPLATVLQQAFALGPMMAVVAVVAVVFGEPPRLSWLQVVPALGLMALFNLGITFIASRLTIHIRDIAQLLPFLVRIVFYVSGVLFSIRKTIDEGLLRRLLEVNPVHVYISLVRGAFGVDTPAPLEMWLFGVGWAALAIGVGFVFFWQAEERYARE